MNEWLVWLSNWFNIITYFSFFISNKRLNAVLKIIICNVTYLLFELELLFIFLYVAVKWNIIKLLPLKSWDCPSPFGTHIFTFSESYPNTTPTIVLKLFIVVSWKMLPSRDKEIVFTHLYFQNCRSRVLLMANLLQTKCSETFLLIHPIFGSFCSTPMSHNKIYVEIPFHNHKNNYFCRTWMLYLPCASDT